MTEPVFSVGDTVIEVPAYVGMLVNPKEFIIIATYKNEHGFWHVAETVDSFGNKIHVPLIDGTAAFSLVRKAAEKPQKRLGGVEDRAALERDLEKIREDWERVLAPLRAWWGSLGKNVL